MEKYQRQNFVSRKISFNFDVHLITHALDRFWESTRFPVFASGSGEMSQCWEKEINGIDRFNLKI